MFKGKCRFSSSLSLTNLFLHKYFSLNRTQTYTAHVLGERYTQHWSCCGLTAQSICIPITFFLGTPEGPCTTALARAGSAATQYSLLAQSHQYR